MSAAAAPRRRRGARGRRAGCRRRSSPIPAARASSATGIIWRRTCSPATNCGAATDVVLAVGTRFNQPQTRWGLDGDIKVIRIDLDPVEITRIARPTIGIVADAKEALRSASPRAGRQGTRLAQGRTRSAEGARPTARLRETLGPQCEYLDAIRAELPDDGIYVEDLTQVGYVGRLAFPVYQPRTYIHSGYQGTLGFSYATALGAKVGAARRAGRVDLGRWRVHVQRAGAVDRGAARHRRRSRSCSPTAPTAMSAGCRRTITATG